MEAFEDLEELVEFIVNGAAPDAHDEPVTGQDKSNSDKETRQRSPSKILKFPDVPGLRKPKKNSS